MSENLLKIAFFFGKFRLALPTEIHKISEETSSTQSMWNSKIAIGLVPAEP
jgi:hypothetical protein